LQPIHLLDARHTQNNAPPRDAPEAVRPRKFSSAISFTTAQGSSPLLLLLLLPPPPPPPPPLPPPPPEDELELLLLELGLKEALAMVTTLPLLVASTTTPLFMQSLMKLPSAAVVEVGSTGKENWARWACWAVVGCSME